MNKMYCKDLLSCTNTKEPHAIHKLQFGQVWTIHQQRTTDLLLCSVLWFFLSLFVLWCCCFLKHVVIFITIADIKDNPTHSPLGVVHLPGFTVGYVSLLFLNSSRTYKFKLPLMLLYWKFSTQKVVQATFLKICFS